MHQSSQRPNARNMRRCPTFLPLLSKARTTSTPLARNRRTVAAGTPRWADPGEVDERVIYRRPDAVTLRPGGARPVTAELVDGQPVYRIYRPAYSARGE